MNTWANGLAATQAATHRWPPCAAGCGWPLDPAAGRGHDGTPNTYDVHPGCQPGGQQLRLIKGDSK